MATLPEQFREEYDNHGDTFFAAAQLIVENPDRHFTQAGLAAKVDISQTRISHFTTKLTESGWVKRHENQTTFEWNTDKYDPTERAATNAVFGLYRDLWTVLKAYSQTTTGLWAVFGLMLFVAATVQLFIFIALQTGLFGESALPPTIYLVMGTGLGLSGIILTAITPYQAFVNRSLDSLFD